MFEITGDDIAQLNDADLRTLVGRLCEETLRRLGFSAAAVRYGGHQDAGDGGLDVRVSMLSDTRIDGFIPRPSTGFQVRKPDMPRSKILKEMRPGGKLRPAILELARENGAYIIVSSSGSTSETSLRERRNAMVDAAKQHAKSLTLDFYDRNRLATWVRDHFELVLWVRAKIGKAVPGWQAIWQLGFIARSGRKPVPA